MNKQAHDRKKMPQLILNFDSHPAKLAGWAAPDDATLADMDLTLSLMVGSVLLGSLRRDRPRPDVDTHLGYKGPASGFAVPDHGLAAFAQACGLQDIHLHAVVSGGPTAELPLSAVNERTVMANPLGVRHGIANSAKLVDCWLEGSRNLNFRFDGTAKTAKSIDAYQCLAGGVLVNVAAELPLGGQASIVRISLGNPFDPLLLVFKGEDKLIDAIDFLPFPSLVRGGMHAAERMIAAHGSDEIADTASVSASLLHAWLEKMDRPDCGVTGIEIDSSVHTGLEPILNEDLLAWLGHRLGISLRRDLLEGTQTTTEFVDEKIARFSGAERGGHRLRIPGDSIPTIAAVVSRLPAGTRAQTVTGGMGIVDWNRHGPIWSVWQPPSAGGFDACQPIVGPRFAPSLVVGDGAEGTGGDVAIGWPLALAFRQLPTRIANQSPFSTAPETGWPLAAKEADVSRPLLDVLILFNQRQSFPIPLLESMARQDGVDIRNVVICRPDGEKNSRLRSSANRLFKDRYSIVHQPITVGRLEQIKTACDQLNGDTVLIVDADTLLPDPRTFAVLASMLKQNEVASASCLIRHADEKMGPVSAGYSLTQFNLSSAPAVSFEAIDPAVWRAPSTYPVVASSLALLAVKHESLSRISVAGSSSSRPEVDDLQFGIQMIDSGGINLCTTAISAFSAAGKPRPTQSAISVPYRLSPERLLAIVESSTIIQRIS